MTAQWVGRLPYPEKRRLEQLPIGGSRIGDVAHRHLLDIGAAVGIADQLDRRGVVESAGGIFGGIPAAAQRDHQQTGRAEQLGKDPKRPLPAVRRHVHPHGAEQDQVEPAPERAQVSQVRQRVVHSHHALVRIACGPIAQGAGFDRHHFPAVGREPIGVSPRAGADIAGDRVAARRVMRRVRLIG